MQLLFLSYYRSVMTLTLHRQFIEIIIIGFVYHKQENYITLIRRRE